MGACYLKVNKGLGLKITMPHRPKAVRHNMFFDPCCWRALAFRRPLHGENFRLKDFRDHQQISLDKAPSCYFL